MKKILLSLLILFSAVLVFAGGQQEAIGADNSSLVITDSLGRTVEFDSPVESVITLMPHANKAMRILGCWDKVIGRDQWSDDEVLFPGITDIPVTTGMYGDIDYELVYSLNPDLFLIAWNPGIDANAIIEKLSPDIPVVVMELGNLETITDSINTLAKIFGAEEKASAYENFVNEISELVSGRISNIQQRNVPDIFFKIEGWTFEQFCTLTNKSELVKSTILTAGGRNIAADLPGEWIEDVDREWLTEENIDVVISSISKNTIPGMWGFEDFSQDKAEAEKLRLMKMDCLKNSKAVKDGRVFLMSTEVAGSVESPVAMLYTAKWMHPDLFEDIEPAVYHKRFYTDLLNLDPEVGGFFFYGSN